TTSASARSSKPCAATATISSTPSSSASSRHAILFAAAPELPASSTTTKTRSCSSISGLPKGAAIASSRRLVCRILPSTHRALSFEDQGHMSALPLPVPEPEEIPVAPRPSLPDYLPARMVNEFVYCPRLFFYEWIEGVFRESADTLEGSAQHKRVDARASALPEAGQSEEKIHARSVTLSSES